MLEAEEAVEAPPDLDSDERIVLEAEEAVEAPPDL